MTTTEAKWRDLESGAARLATGPEGAAALEELWSAAVAEVRTLHRDLALWERDPATFVPAIPSLERLLRVLRAQLRPGRDLSPGGWRATVESSRDDLDRALLQFTLQRPAGASGVQSALIVLLAEVAFVAFDRAGDPRWPLPFEMLALEDVDRSGTSVARSVERDEGDGAFVGLLTLHDGKATGNPTDFGVRLGARGAPEWIGGPAARTALAASARAAAAAVSLAEEMRAADVAAATARASLETPAAPAAPRPSSRAGERPTARVARDAGSRQAARAETPAEPPARAAGRATRSATCASCGAALPVGAGFCSGCGAPAPQAAPASSRSRPAAPAASAEPLCAGCGAKLNPGARFCPKCGAVASATSAASSGSTAQVAAPPRCARCGAVGQVGARFCRSCGGPLSDSSSVGLVASAGPSAPVAIPRCARCGGEVSIGARFCRHCGAVTGSGS